MSSVQNVSMRWRAFRALLFMFLGRAANKVLLNRVFKARDGSETRWLRPEFDRFLVELKSDADSLRPIADLDTLSKTGNKIMVELAVLTISAYRTLCQSGVSPADARAAVADIGWNIYGQQIALISLPFRLTSRDPGKRLQRTIRLMLRFPFSAPGAPGYAVKSWSEGGNIHTHFTHCPPQSFVRKLIAQRGDNGELQAFSESWCQYDWPGADIIAGDRQRGHYVRRKTLSGGDAVCDMCWKGQNDETAS